MNRNAIDLNLLVVFDAVVHEKSLTRARRAAPRHRSQKSAK